jgi:uncharacterized protein YndB with AHSA1/START domain
MSMTTERIEKQVVLRAPRERVWQAISNAKQFGSWFGVELDGPFVTGTRVTGRVVPTTMDAEIAKAQKPYEGVPVALTVERIEPPRVFSYRWHPFAIDRNVDYSSEPTTLVTFALEEAGDNTRLTITESGFDRLPVERRGKAFTANEQGWASQLKLIENYVTKS